MKVVVLAIVVLLAGCTTTAVTTQSEAEVQSGYTYIPIDPFKVEVEPGIGCKSRGKIDIRTLGPSHILHAFPDNAVRVYVEEISQTGSVSYGPASFASKGDNYRITVDYINADTVSRNLWIARWALSKDGATWESLPLGNKPLPDTVKPESVYYEVLQKVPEDPRNYTKYALPIYVGIGLRVIANVKVIGNTANLSGLGLIGAEAEAQNLQGSLVVQTLGVNGKSIASALPIQSELNRTTAQGAVVAVASIKALLYEDETVIAPRVVGMYLPFASDQQLINEIISRISEKPVEWSIPCSDDKADTAVTPAP